MNISDKSLNSMAPLISPQDKVIVNKKKKLKTNDVVVFSEKEKLIAHRVIYISPDKNYVVTKGDNNKLSDGKIYAEQILGTVKKVIREGEKISINHAYHLHSTIYLRELKKVAKVFEKKKIRYVILKGLPTHLYYLNTPPKRFYFDTDILIDKSQKGSVLKILKSLGYKKQPSTLYGKVIKNSTEMNMFKFTPPFATRIDLHLDPGITFTKLHTFNRLLPKTKDFATFLLKNTKTVKVEGIKVNILNLETEVIYLLLHFYRHNYQGYFRLELIEKILKKNKVDWEKLAVLLKRFELGNLVYPAILMLEKYNSVRFPRKFIKKITPGGSKKMFGEMIFRFISPFEEGTRAQEGAKRYIFILFLSPQGIFERLSILFYKETWIYFFPTIKSLALNSFKKLFKSS